MTIIVQHLGSLGDTIVSIPALRAICAEWPSARVILMHNSWRTPRPGVVSPARVLDRAYDAASSLGRLGVLDRTSDAALSLDNHGVSRNARSNNDAGAYAEGGDAGAGLVDAYLPYAADASGLARLQVIAETWRAIRRMRADLAVFIGPTDRSAAALRRDRAFFRAAGITRLIGFHPCADANVLHEAQGKLDRLADDGVMAATSPSHMRLPLLTPSTTDTTRVTAWLATHGITPDAPLVAIGPTTMMPSKVWPADRFVELGRRFLSAGVRPIVDGAPSDRANGDGLISAWGGGLNACGSLSLHESAALLARCGRYVGLDSGPAHLAAAVGCRCIVLTSGRARPGQWDPIGSDHVILRHRTPCECCRLEVCPLADHPCMRGLTVDAVWAAAGFHA
jgi:ADP-heptose:LPS heptosyltransferase